LEWRLLVLDRLITNPLVIDPVVIDPLVIEGFDATACLRARLEMFWSFFCGVKDS
jgi:hypothetical protein